MAKILIVDDSLIVRINLRRILTAAGHEIAGEAENGQDALEKYQAERPDIVTMDITMPVLDGISALKQLVVQDPDARVIMISAMGQSNKVLDALNAGARNFITKPFEAEKVVAAIHAVGEPE
jgi:two-component system, chemotaxis family, chemotaxis protein CheY